MITLERVYSPRRPGVDRCRRRRPERAYAHDECNQGDGLQPIVLKDGRAKICPAWYRTILIAASAAQVTGFAALRRRAPQSRSL